MSGIFKSLYNVGTLPTVKKGHYQRIIRDTEWAAVKEFIPDGSSFLDVGCGAGYALILAQNMGCVTTGVDPVPYAYGVGRVSKSNSIVKNQNVKNQNLNIFEGSAEKIPFPDKHFDVVYSSHVLEHIVDKDRALQEMKRVLKDDGTLIIGMPTATMAWINLISQLMFTTHKRIVYILAQILGIKKENKFRLINILIPRSHSFSHKTICFDLKTYKISIWLKTIENEFTVVKELRPALYPYPDFIQLFKIKKFDKFSSSVFFVGKK